MNIFGSYKEEKQDGKPSLNPTIFIVTNWPVLCKIVGLTPTPQLTVLSGTEPNITPGADTRAMWINPNPAHGNVVLNRTDLNTDVMALQMAGGSILGLLWALMSSMVRGLYVRKTGLPFDEMFDWENLRSAGYPENLLETLSKCIKFPLGTPEYQRVMDVLVVQTAIQVYISWLQLDDQVDQNKLLEILTQKKSTFNPKLIQFPS